MNTLDRAIYHHLRTDVALARDIPGGVHYMLRVAGDAYPMVVFAQSAGTSQRVFPGVYWRQLVYLIKVVDEGTSSANAKILDDRLVKKFDSSALPLTGDWDTAVCHRTSDVVYHETANGRVFWHVGGLYTFGLRRQ